MLTSLSTYIKESFTPPGQSDYVLITQRQRRLLDDSDQYLKDALDQIQAGIETDIIASTLQGFVTSIKDVVGEIPNRDILQNIFSNFCVGK